MSLYLLIPDIFGTVGRRFFHGCEAHHLKQVVLHDVTDYPKLVEIPTTPHCTEWLLESDNHIGYVVSVPYWLKDRVGKPEVQGWRGGEERGRGKRERGRGEGEGDGKRWQEEKGGWRGR